MKQVIHSKLENYTWTVENGLNINPVPMDSVTVNKVNDYLSVQMNGSKPFGGALVTCKLPPPPDVASYPFIGFDFDIYLPEPTVQLIRNLECDWKGSFVSAPNSTTKIQNVADMSAQLASAKGIWQIDDAKPSWIDTPIKDTLPVETWKHYAMRFQMDYVNKKASYLSVNDGQVPTALQSLPFLTTNWAAVSAAQFQLDLDKTPGGLAARYKNVTVTFSDSPF